MPADNCAAGFVERAGQSENVEVTGWVRGGGVVMVVSPFHIWRGAVFFVRWISLLGSRSVI